VDKRDRKEDFEGITDTAQTKIWMYVELSDRADVTEANRLCYVANKARRAAHAAKVKARKIRRKHAKDKVYD
jgi:hypothetical protein